MWPEERWSCIAKHSNVCFIYNIKFKSSLWTPSQNSFSPCIQAYSQLHCVIPNAQQTHFHVAKISYPPHHPIFPCIYLSYSHHKPIFYAYSMSESHTWNVVCERQRDPTYISRERMVVIEMQRWV